MTYKRYKMTNNTILYHFNIILIHFYIILYNFCYFCQFIYHFIFLYIVFYHFIHSYPLFILLFFILYHSRPRFQQRSTPRLRRASQLRWPQLQLWPRACRSWSSSASMSGPSCRAFSSSLGVRGGGGLRIFGGPPLRLDI